MNTQWQKLAHSKGSVKKVAQRLVENDLNLEQKIECLSTLANFRSAHDYPMQSMIGYFRKKTFEVDTDAMVVRRLKRIPSIINKLKRFPKMQITSMGDIGGIRVVTKDLSCVHTIKNNILKGRTRNQLLSEKNYIEDPKESGYRGIHLIYKYQGQKTEYQGFRVELQIRSQIQHAWATAVEVVGTFLQHNLKASQGDPVWLDFFKLVSQAFASMEEKNNIDDAIKNKLRKQTQDLEVIDTLVSFSLATKHSDKKEGLYLLQLDVQEKSISARYFSQAFSLDAYDEYRRIEQEISENTNKDVVLVSAKSLKELKKAYPNYFADTLFFVQILKKVIHDDA